MPNEIPQKMPAYRFPRANGIDTLELHDVPVPIPGRGQILVRMRAASLNYRDLNVAAGRAARGTLPDNLVPLSDGAGEVARVGPGVSRVNPGDRVAGLFMQSWLGGEIEPSHVDSSRGGSIDGVLAEYVLFDQDGVISIPQHLSFEEGATLPCAGVTAWNALYAGRSLRTGETVLRRGARPGDVVYVSGTLGDAALGLRALRGELPELDAAQREFLADRYRLPRPRLRLGQRLVGTARAMMDISDGLVADLGHICETSGVGAVVEAARLPLSPAARAAIVADASRLMAALSAGDDYELLFTASPEAAAGIAALASETDVPVTAIGRIERGTGVRVVDGKGAPIAVTDGGYRHF